MSKEASKLLITFPFVHGQYKQTYYLTYLQPHMFEEKVTLLLQKVNCLIQFSFMGVLVSKLG